MKSRVQAGYVELVALGVLWGSVGVIVRPVRVDAAGIALIRSAIGCAGALAFMMVRGRLHEVRLKGRRGLLILDGVMLGIHWTLMFEAFKRLSVATAILLVFVGPVFVAAAAWPVLRERVEARTIGALGLSVGGMLLITVPAWDVQDPLGVVFALLSAVFFAAIMLAGKILTREYAPPAILIWQLGVAAIAVAPLALAGRFDGLAEAAPRLLTLGLVHTAVAGFLYFAALTVVKAQHVGVLTYLEPATALLYAWWFLNERPSLSTVAGGVLIVAAGLWIVASRGPLPGTPEGPVAPPRRTLHN